MSGVGNTGKRDLSSLFDCLTSHRRRTLLGIIQERDSVTREELATTLAAQVAGTRRAQVTDEARERIQATLHHLHLPKLDSAGLLEYDATEATVTSVSHPAFRDSAIRRILADEATVDPQSLDALFAALADDRKRTVLDVLNHQYQRIHEETLAREVVGAERDTAEPDTTDEEVAELLVSLRHHLLPSLAEAGLVDYDPEERTVAYEGHPELRVPWMHSQLEPNFRESLTESPAGAKVGDIEGRENVVSFGQSLVDTADEELFMMFTTTGLLEAGCFARILQAAERGVNVYLGTRDPTVREFVRENAPSVALWEPETNWLDLPIEGDHIGRLVFADREAVMIGTLNEKTHDGVRTERAIVGEGADNTLVALMRQMLRTRLEQFAEEGDEMEAEPQF